ncbi:MAG: hypothetical protein GY768_15200 [Planctomycetaceae bacterium]|nr:hypothetical protein [Planctomycetaceae bacterium]
MKLDPRYGYFPRWPENGNTWIHPADITIARNTIPSFQIWRREETHTPYELLSQGEITIRVLPSLWTQIPSEGIEIGDWVEVKSRLQNNTYRIAKIREMHWNTRSQSIDYRVEFRQFILPNKLTRADLRLLGRMPLEEQQPPD